MGGNEARIKEFMKINQMAQGTESFKYSYVPINLAHNFWEILFSINKLI